MDATLVAEYFSRFQSGQKPPLSNTQLRYMRDGLKFVCDFFKSQANEPVVKYYESEVKRVNDCLDARKFF